MPGGDALFSLGDPLARAVILPLVVSAFSTGAIRLAFGDGRGSTLANLGLGIGLLAAWGVLFGFPLSPTSWSALDMGEKTFCLILFGLLLGAAADRLPALDPVILLLLTSWPVLLVLWLYEPLLTDGLQGPLLIRFGLLIIGASTLFVRLREEQDNGQNATVYLLWFGLALGLVAYVTGQYPLQEAGAAIAAATVGYLLWNLPVTRYPFGFAALLAGGSGVAALAATLLARDVTVPLLPLFLLLFAGEIGTRLFRQKRGASSIVLGGLLPTAAAVLLAWLTR